MKEGEELNIKRVSGGFIVTHYSKDYRKEETNLISDVDIMHKGWLEAELIDYLIKKFKVKLNAYVSHSK